MKKYKFYKTAKIEFKNAVEYYKEQSQSATKAFIDEFKKSINYICQYPEGSPFLDETIRSKNLTSYPYSIHYIVLDDIILITTVAHHSRHPDYWKDRMKDIP